MHAPFASSLTATLMTRQLPPSFVQAASAGPVVLTGAGDSTRTAGSDEHPVKSSERQPGKNEPVEHDALRAARATGDRCWSGPLPVDRCIVKNSEKRATMGQRSHMASSFFGRRRLFFWKAPKVTDRFGR